MIIDGTKIAGTIKEELSKKAEQFERANKRKCTLAMIIVGDDPASHVYVSTKERACERVGIKSMVTRLSATTTQGELLKTIDQLNRDKTVDGILVQLPLPRHIDESKITVAIDPKKDVDGFHPQSHHTPCTPLGIMELVKHAIQSKIGAHKVTDATARCAGLHAVVVGRSNIVGRPVAKLLLDADCTVTVAHSKTRDLGAITRLADILVVAVGKKHLVTRDMVKPGAIVIDVGITSSTPNGPRKVYGDVDFDDVKDIAGALTPVPGGVGPMTVAMLLSNVLRACE